MARTYGHLGFWGTTVCAAGTGPGTAANAAVPDRCKGLGTSTSVAWEAVHYTVSPLSMAIVSSTIPAGRTKAACVPRDAESFQLTGRTRRSVDR